MNILIFCSYFGLDKTVAAKRMTSLSLFLLNEGWSVSVVTRHKDYIIPDNLKKIQIIESNEITKTGNMFYNFKTFKENQKIMVNQFISIVEKSKFDCIILSGSPFFYFSVSRVAHNLKIPCILDFRDPWTRDYRDLKDVVSIRKNLYRLSHHKDEKEAIRFCSAYVTVTDGWCKLFQRIYPKYQYKCYLIQNGYDNILFERKKVALDGKDKIVISIFGKMSYYTEKFTKIFLAAAKEYEDKICVYQVGENEPRLYSLLSKIGLENNFVRNTGFLSYEDGLSFLSLADAYLVIDTRKSALGTKVYDYIFLNKPIIYVGPSNTALSNFVSEFTNGFCCNTKDDVCKAFEKIISGRPLFLDNHIDISKYSREAQNKKWKQLIEMVIQKE